MRRKDCKRKVTNKENIEDNKTTLLMHQNDIDKLLGKNEKSKRDIIEIMNILDESEHSKFPRLKHTSDKIESNSFDLLDIYVYLRTCRNKSSLFNFELIENIINYLHCFNEDLNEIYKELFVRVMSLLLYIAEININDVFVIKKIFYTIFSFMYKRRVFAEEIKITAFNICMNILEFFNGFSLSDIIADYNNFDNFLIMQITFNKYIFINFIVFQIRNENGINKEQFLKMKNEIFYSLQKQDDYEVIVDALKICDDSIENQNVQHCVFFMAIISIEESLEFCSELFPLYKTIFIHYKKHGKISSFESSLLTFYDYKSLDDFLKKILIFCLDRLKKNDSKYLILKALLSFNYGILTEREQIAFISHLVYIYPSQSFRNKEIVLQTLGNMKYSRFFDLIQSDISSESILLKKSIFHYAKMSIDSQDKINDFVKIYISFLRSDNMRDFIITNFTFDTLFSDCVNPQEISTFRLFFIDTLSRYIYFYDDKSFVRDIRIEAKTFIPYKEDVFRMKILKHLSRYHKDEFIDLQSDLIFLLRIKNSNYIFIDDILSILIEISDSLTSMSQIQIIEMSEFLLKYDICARNVGLLFKRIGNKNVINARDLLIYPFLEPEKFIVEFDYEHDSNSLNDFQIRTILFYLEENMQCYRKYEKHIHNILTMAYSINSAFLKNEEVIHYEIINHFLYMTNDKLETSSHAEGYQSILQAHLNYFLKLVLHKQRCISSKSFRLITRLLKRGYILPHKCLPEIVCYNTIFYNPLFQDIISLYSSDIINYLDLIQKRIDIYFFGNKLLLKKENLSFAIIYNALKSDRKRERLLNKCLLIVEEMNVFSTYFVLKNLTCFNLTKKEKVIINKHLNKMLDELDIIITCQVNKNVFVIYLILIFRDKIKHGMEFDMHQDIIYGESNVNCDRIIEELRKEIIRLK